MSMAGWGNTQMYVEQLEEAQGFMPGFREFLEYANVLCGLLEPGGGELSSRQIVAIAWALYRLMLHGSRKGGLAEVRDGDLLFLKTQDVVSREARRGFLNCVRAKFGDEVSVTFARHGDSIEVLRPAGGKNDD